jgi:AbrB family looped-hinge helix DNA binding protein
LAHLSDMKIVEIDEKGHVVIPKDVRAQNGISTPGRLLFTVEGSGKIGLQSIEVNLRRAQEIGRRKLFSWRGERHDEDRLALRLTRKGKPR